eukprot:jgi/Botrbrau1/21999/Bobra.0024s0015.1
MIKHSVLQLFIFGPPKSPLLFRCFHKGIAGRPKAAVTQAVNGNGNGKSSKNGSFSSSEIPEQLQGLVLNSEGLLIDEKTGELINEFGATRFDIAVHAIRGEFDPPKGVQNTERNTGLLLGSLKKFPLDYTFTVVARKSQDSASLLQDVRQVIGRVCGCEITDEQCQVTERMQGKFLSIRISARISSPGLLDDVFDELGKDSRIMMRY